MAENPRCLFTSQEVACVILCPLFEKATDRMGMNRWRRVMNAIELGLKNGRKVNPEDLPDPVSGTEFATFSGASLEQCFYFQKQIQEVTRKSI